MDDEILKTVHSIFGKDVKIVDCEKMSSVRQEEVLFINGVPVQLDGLAGDEADAIKAALLIGQMPSVDLLNQLLLQAGLLKQPVQLDTSLSVKSSMVTTEEVSVSRGGCVLDERSTETKEDYTYNSNKKEFWQPHLRNANETGCSGIPEMKEMNSVKDSPPKRPERKNREDASLNKSATISIFSQPTPSKNQNAEDTAERYTVGKMTKEYDSDATKQLCSSDTASSIASTISNYSTYPTDSSMDITSTALASSSCSFMLNQAANASNILPQGVCKKSSLSYDSGHDGIFHSMSQRAANSLSSCCDLVSSNSCNEIVQGNNLEDAGAAKMKTTTTQKNVVPYTENYDVELKGSNAQRQMLPMPSNVNSGRKSGGSNGSATSIKKAINNADTSLSTVQSSTASTNVTFSGSETSASPSSSTKNHRDHANIADTQHLQKQGQKSYQHIRPQTLLAQYQQQQQTVDEQHCLVYYDGQLVSGSLEALIEHMVPTCDYYPTSTYIFSFLLSARLFIRPHELLSKISTTWEQQQQHEIQNTDVVDDAKEVRKCFLNSTDATISPDKMCAGATITTAVSQKKQRHQQLSMQLSAHNCIRLLAEWIETFPYDFRDERLMQQVRILARKCVYIDNALGKQVSRILQLLVQRLTVLEKYEDFLQSLTTSEFNATDSKQERTFAGSTTVPTTHNPLGRSSTTAISTAIKSQPLLQSSLSAGNASTSLSTQAAEFHSHYSNVDALQHNHPQSDSSTNSVNLTLHHLSGHFTNSNSASSFNEVPGIMDLCPSSAQLAHQLTTIELDRLSHIGPEEFVQAFAKEYQHTFASQAAGNTSTQDSADFTGNVAAVMCPSLNDIKKTRNLESYVQWFNRLSYLTASEIVKYSKKKLRVRIIEYWIETARECFNIGNFNSLMAIIAGLNLAPISRLKKTWSKVQSAKFSVLEHQMDPTSNFNSYRSTLKAAMWRSEGATDERERIIIPFFSLFVKDLYFLNEGCSNRLSNNHINFEKCSQLSKQVMEFNEWKKVNCPFEKHPIVIMFLQSSAVLNENTLSMASFECEPPENTQEKGRYKTLKSETKQQMQQQLQEQKHQQQH